MSRFTTSMHSRALDSSSLLSPSQQLRRMAESGKNQLAVALATSPPDAQADFWTCPQTGLVVPKGLAANLQWRQKLLAQARQSEPLQRQLRWACSKSILFWINAFCWTYRQKIVDASGEEKPVKGHAAHHPFITWPVQDEFCIDLIHCINEGEDAGIVKSRDMGASWICLTVIHWFWQFHKDVNFHELSRREDLVDQRGNMDSLFEKHRYLLRWQPTWLVPRVKDTFLKLENLDAGSTITGESTNQHAGQGARKTAILLDEFGRVSNGEEIELATADTTACRIFNSTPSGPGTGFHKLVTRKGGIKLLTMPWWRHPEKAKDAYQHLTADGKVKWTSPWYQKEVQRRSKKDVAQNLDMDFGQAGDNFFDYGELERHRLDHVREPLLQGVLSFPDLNREDLRKRVRRQDITGIKLETSQHPTWKFWIPLVDGRPPQQYNYVLASDISNGSGDSNSVTDVLCVELGQIVAEYANARISPEDFAEHTMLAALWFGGKDREPFIIWENNGPGGIYGRKIVKGGYTRFYRNKTDDLIKDQKTKRYGWHSNKQKKENLLGRYREQLARDQIVCRSEATMDEAQDYIYDEVGGVIPGRLKKEKEGARATHGDRVIAAALCVLGKEALPKQGNADRKPPPKSFAGRREARREAKRRGDPWLG